MSFIVTGNDVISAITGGVFTFLRIFTASDILTTTPAFILASYIIANNIGVMTEPDDGLDWPLHVAYMPDSITVKNDAGALYDTPGLKDGRLMEGQVISHHGLQLKIRSTDHITGWSKIEAIDSSLSAVQNDNIIINANEFQINNIKRVGDIISLGRERGSKGRMFFTTNYLITLKRIV